LSVKDIFLEAILHETADAILFLDPDEIIRYWNRGAEDIYGYLAGEVLGKHYVMLIPESLREQEVREFRRLMAEKGYVRRSETQQRKKDGTLIDVELTRTLLRDVQGNILGTSVVVRDITQRRLLQERVASMECLTAMTRVAGKVAHEMRTPLGVFTLKRDLLEEEIESLLSQLRGEKYDHRKETVRRYFRELEEESQRLNDIIEDYLSLSKVRTPQLDTIDFVEYLRDWLEEYDGRDAAVSLQLQVAPGIAQAPVSIDPDQFRRVLENLYRNSLDAIETRGAIRLELSQADERYCLSFTDNGVGIPPRMLERLFVPFETTKKSGTGLGLYLVREIIQAHHGEVSIESRPGEGTKVRVWLPRQEGGGARR